jgi:hypothetical protein
MKKLLKESGDPFRDIVKKYAQYYRDSEMSRISKQDYNAWLQSHADKISPSTREKIKKQVDTQLKKKNEASTTAGVPGVMTPFAFSSNKKSTGNVRAATQFGYKLAKPVKNNTGYALENQMYSEPAYANPAQNIEPIDTYTDSNGLVQHGDPELDPALAGHEQGMLPVTEHAIRLVRQMRKEGVGGLLYKLKNEADQQSPAPAPAPAPAQPAVPTQPVPTTPKAPVDVNLQSYDIQPDFTAFDSKLKNSTEQLKTDLQKKIQDSILDKKIVVRASKGYKQPEADYTINVTGVQIDYYYDRYVIVIMGREESKQKTAKFFVKPGFKIKILGSADVKPKDQYQIAKSKALVDPNKQTATQSANSVTSEEPPATGQTAGEKPPQSQPTA